VKVSGNSEGRTRLDSCLAGIRIEASSASRTHFFSCSSRNMGYVPERRYDICFLRAPKKKNRVPKNLAEIDLKDRS